MREGYGTDVFIRDTTRTVVEGWAVGRIGGVSSGMGWLGPPGYDQMLHGRANGPQQPEEPTPWDGMAGIPTMARRKHYAAPPGVVVVVVWV